jgi:DNA-binding transcriptional MocR family regulator
MTRKPYKHHKKGAGRHVQLSEYLQTTPAWSDLKPGPRALYIAVKRRFNGSNNGRIVLSHREAALALNVHRNTVGPYFQELIEHGFIRVIQGPYLGPEGIGKSGLLALTELPTHDGQSATKDFLRWAKQKKPRTKSVSKRHKNQDDPFNSSGKRASAVLKIVP